MNESADEMVSEIVHGCKNKGANERMVDVQGYDADGYEIKAGKVPMLILRPR